MSRSLLVLASLFLVYGVSAVRLGVKINSVPAVAVVQVDEGLTNGTKSTPGGTCDLWSDCDACVAMHFCVWAVDDKICLEEKEARHDQKICHSCDHSVPTLAPTDAPTVYQAPARLIPAIVVTEAPVEGQASGPTGQMFPATVVGTAAPPAGQCRNGEDCPTPVPKHDVQEAEISNSVGDAVEGQAVDASAAATQAPTTPVETIEPETAEEPLKTSEMVAKLEERLKEIADRIDTIESELKDEKSALHGKDDKEDSDDEEDDKEPEGEDHHAQVKRIHASIVHNIRESKKAVEDLLNEIVTLKQHTENEEAQSQQAPTEKPAVIFATHFTTQQPVQGQQVAQSQQVVAQTQQVVAQTTQQVVQGQQAPKTSTLLSATEKARLTAPVSKASQGHVEPAYAENV